MSLLEIKNVSYSYNGKQKALNDVSFSIDTTGVVGLIGANGAGKSTLMNLICGLLHPKEGEISINNCSIAKNRISYLSNIGFLPQQPPLYPELTIREFLTHIADFKNIEKSLVSNAVAEVMEKCGLTHFKNRLIKNLSGGYQQRVGIAQAIIHSPPIIILDEPTNGLDPKQIIELRQLVNFIAKDTLILLSTHIISEIEKISDRIIVLEQGKLIIDKSLEDFRNMLPNNQIIVTIKENIGRALEILQTNEFTVQKKSTDQLLIFEQLGGDVTRVMTLLFEHKIKIYAIYPITPSIEDVYHSLVNIK